MHRLPLPLLAQFIHRRRGATQICCTPSPIPCLLCVLLWGGCRLAGSKKVGKGKKAGKGGDAAAAPAVPAVDHSYLSFEYHVAILGGMGMLLPAMKARKAGKTPGNLRVLVVGLGGGLLPMFLHTHFDVLDVTSVELDKDIADVAREYFGFKERTVPAGGNNRVIVGDGLAVVNAIADSVKGAAAAAAAAADSATAESSAGVEDATAGVAALSVSSALPQQNVIVIDVDCKDLSLGMPFPPQVCCDVPVCCNLLSPPPAPFCFCCNASTRRSLWRPHSCTPCTRRCFPVALWC